MAAAFGSNSNRKLDTTEPGIVKNPGPGQYKEPITKYDQQRMAQLSSVFKSTQKRKENYSSDLSFPPPSTYNL